MQCVTKMEGKYFYVALYWTWIMLSEDKIDTIKRTYFDNKMLYLEMLPMTGCFGYYKYRIVLCFL